MIVIIFRNDWSPLKWSPFTPQTTFECLNLIFFFCLVWTRCFHLYSLAPLLEHRWFEGHRLFLQCQTDFGYLVNVPSGCWMDDVSHSCTAVFTHTHIVCLLLLAPTIPFWEPFYGAPLPISLLSLLLLLTMGISACTSSPPVSPETLKSEPRRQTHIMLCSQDNNK